MPSKFVEEAEAEEYQSPREEHFAHGDPDGALHQMEEGSDTASNIEAGDEMDAVMALAGFGQQAKAEPDPRATRHDLMDGCRACDVSRFEDRTAHWPYSPEKGWFTKAYSGQDVPFLERLFLILSFGNSELITQKGRRLQHAIRWKEPRAAEAWGAPPGVPCFEIVDVALFEAEVYPQYASGSFNKTASKWGIVSPSPTKKLDRECMYLAESAGGAGVLKPMPVDATVADVYEHAATAVRPIHRQQSRRAKPAGQPQPLLMEQIMQSVRATVLQIPGPRRIIA
jgi:hypothetical protein